MIVKRLLLGNFRNYEKADIHFGSGLNLITGENGQGKTNLLESLVYLSLTRSHRIYNDRQLIRDDKEYAYIRCVYEDDMDRQLEAVIYKNGKTLKVRNQPVKKSSEFIGLLNVVLFSPDDLSLFSDAPKDRRRIINQELTKISSSYLYAINHYMNLLKEKNVLLKNNRVDNTLLDTLDEQMAQDEENIILMRNHFIEGIREDLVNIYRELSETDAEVNVYYKTFMDLTGSLTKEDILKKHITERKKDLDNHVATTGIHRDDMVFEMNGKNVIMTASQGQKRMLMLAFKLALMKYIEKQTKKKPILLLDDVLSELDLKRQRRLLEMLEKPYQCILTATEVPEFIRKNATNEIIVSDGNITYIKQGGAL